MSLFDDLLTKVQPSSSGSNSSHSNGPITISDSTPIITSQEVHMPQAQDAVTIETTNTNVTINDVLNETPQTPAVTMSTVAVENPTPVETAIPLITMDTQTVEPTPIIADETPVAMEDELILPENNTTAFIEETYSPLTDIPESIILSDEVVESSPLFDMTSDTTTSMNNSLIEDTPSEEVIPQKSYSKISFSDTAEYIGHALEEVEMLLSSIDQEIKNVIEERDSHELQEKHFAELKFQAEERHQKMLVERTHAKKMETYFKHEQAKSLAPQILKPEATKKSSHVTHVKAKTIKAPTQAANNSLFALAA